MCIYSDTGRLNLTGNDIIYKFNVGLVLKIIDFYYAGFIFVCISFLRYQQISISPEFS